MNPVRRRVTPTSTLTTWLGTNNGGKGDREPAIARHSPENLTGSIPTAGTKPKNDGPDLGPLGFQLYAVPASSLGCVSLAQPLLEQRVADGENDGADEQAHDAE